MCNIFNVLSRLLSFGVSLWDFLHFFFVTGYPLRPIYLVVTITPLKCSLIYLHCNIFLFCCLKLVTAATARISFEFLFHLQKMLRFFPWVIFLSVLPLVIMGVYLWFSFCHALNISPSCTALL